MEKEFYRIEAHEIIVLDMFAPTSFRNEIDIISNKKIGWIELYTLDHNLGFLTYENKNSRKMIAETLFPYVEKY